MAGRPLSETQYLFIDGAYLREVIQGFGREYYGEPDLPIDYSQISRNFTKMFYYDCPPPRREGETDAEYAARQVPQQQLYQYLRSLRGWHVFEGVTKRTGRRAQQKEVDIQIAVDMLTHSYRRNMHQATLLTGDQDFRPLIEAIVRDGMFIDIWFEPATASADLIHAADARREIGVYAIESWLTVEYRRKHPLPQGIIQPKAIEKDAKLIAVGKDANGDVELYQEAGGFVIARVYPSNEHLGHWLHVRHQDLPFLKKVFAAAHGEVVWPQQ